MVTVVGSREDFEFEVLMDYCVGKILIGLMRVFLGGKGNVGLDGWLWVGFVGEEGCREDLTTETLGQR